MDLSSIKLNDTVYSLKDTSARQQIATAQTDISNRYTKTEVNDKLLEKANSTHSHAISDITNLQSTLDNKAGRIGGTKRYYVGRLTDTSTYYKVLTISCVDVQTVYAQFTIHGIEHALEIRGGVELRYSSSTSVDMYVTMYSAVFSTSTCDLCYKKISSGEYEIYIKPNGWVGAVDCYIDNAVAIQNTSLDNYITWDGLNRISTASGTTTDATDMTTVTKA